MNLKNISDRQLLEETINIVKKEREILGEVLHYLAEVQRRRLFSALGYKSLFDFAIQELSYSEDQAYRRISAMRLINELPEVEEKINSGGLTLTQACKAYTFFRHEKRNNVEISKDEKLSFIDQIEHKTLRETEKLTFLSSSEPTSLKPDRINLVDDKTIELKFIADEDLQEKINSLKGLLAHKYPSISLGDLFSKLCDLGLTSWRHIPSRKQAVRKIISFATLKGQVLERARYKCEKCSSTYALEIDHIIPKAKGGGSSLDNLRVLCRTCNQRAAIKEFGIKKMDEFING